MHNPVVRVALSCLIYVGHSRRVHTAAGPSQSNKHQPKPKQLVGFPRLQASDFQHPHDRQLWYPVHLPLRLVARYYEEVLFQEIIGNGVKVSPKQYPTLHGLVVEAAAQLNIPSPEVFVVQDPEPEAYTLGVQGKRPLIILHSSLIDLLTLQEVKAVIGHELGHLKCEHGLVTPVFNILEELDFDDNNFHKLLSDGVFLIMSMLALIFNDDIRAFLCNSVTAILIRLATSYLLTRHGPKLMQWCRSAEFSCDRASLLVAQDANVVMSYLMKLTGGTLKLSQEMSAKEFARQANEYDRASSSWLGRWIRRRNLKRETHPLPVLRAREVQRYARSAEYKRLEKRLATAITVGSNKA